VLKGGGAGFAKKVVLVSIINEQTKPTEWCYFFLISGAGFS
jgi:hypothetical protein